MPSARICLVASIAALLCFVFVAHAYWLTPNHDSAIYVIEAQKLLAGGRFYDDIMEITPPLIVLLTVPGVLISQATGLDPWAAFSAWICVLIIISMLLALPYLGLLYPNRTEFGALLYFAAIALLPAYSFSQREHLTAVLFLPGLLWFAAREAGWRQPLNPRCLITLLLAAVGVLIKPFFLVVPAILVLLRAASHRDWRMLFGVETVVIGFVSLIYALVVYAFYREWLSSAALAAQVYFAFETSWPVVLKSFWRVEFAFAAAVIAFLFTPLAPERRVLLRQLTVAAAGFLAIAILQHKGWGYHALPATVLTFLLLALLGLDLFELFMKKRRLDIPARASFLAFSLTLLFVGGVSLESVAYHSNLAYYRRQNFLNDPFVAAVDQLAAGRPWVALSTSVSPAFPTALVLGGQWSSRSVHQWLPPGILKLRAGGPEDRARARHLQELATSFVIEDLDRYRPKLVAVAVGPQQAIAVPFDFLAFFAEDENFSRVWSPYRLAKSIEGWQFYLREE